MNFVNLRDDIQFSLLASFAIRMVKAPSAVKEACSELKVLTFAEGTGSERARGLRRGPFHGTGKECGGRRRLIALNVILRAAEGEKRKQLECAGTRVQCEISCQESTHVGSCRSHKYLGFRLGKYGSWISSN